MLCRAQRQRFPAVYLVTALDLTHLFVLAVGQNYGREPGHVIRSKGHLSDVHCLGNWYAKCRLVGVSFGRWAAGPIRKHKGETADSAGQPAVNTGQVQFAHL